MTIQKPEDQLAAGPDPAQLGGCLLWILRVSIAGPLAFVMAAVILAVGEMLLGIQSTGEGMSDAQFRLAMALTLGMTVLGARWLRSHGPLQSLPAGLTPTEQVQARMHSVVASLGAGLHLAAVTVLSVVVFVVWVIGMIIVFGDEFLTTDDPRSNQIMLTLLILSFGIAVVMWRRLWAGGRFRSDPLEPLLEGERELTAMDVPSTDPIPANQPQLDDSGSASEGIDIRAYADMPAVSVREQAEPATTKPPESSKSPRSPVPPKPLEPNDEVGTVAGAGDETDDRPPLSPTVLDELDKRQRRALWLLSENGSVSLSELAEGLDTRKARIPGFMNGLDRQLQALGYRCFRSETLPTGEPQYVFIPQEPSA